MESLKLQTEVDIKCFGGKVTVEKNIGGTGSAKRYVYKISHKNKSYILKGFKIHLEHLNPGDKKSVNMFREGIEEISEVYQEYCFARAACAFNPHFVKPLFLDYTIKVASTRSCYTYMYIEIIFEDGGVSLNKLESVNIDDVYNFMRQSADALVLLHDIGIAHFDIKPENMVYEKENDILKVIDMGSAFGSATATKIIGSTGTFDGKIRSGTLQFAPPEVLRTAEKLGRVPGIEITIGGVDVYCWAMCFYSMIKRRSADDLVNDYRKYKLASEINYKDYVEIVEEDLDSIKTKNSAEKNKIDFIKKLLTNSLKYRPKDRPTMKIIVNDMKKFEQTHNIKISHTNIVSIVRAEALNQGQNKEERKGLMPPTKIIPVKDKDSDVGGKKVCKMPLHKDSDLASPKVKEMEKKLAPFKFEEPLDESLEMENTVKLADESLYTGQWNEKGHRHGRGICTYSDGSKYEGYWRNDKRNGKGRLIYNNGDVYEGDWINDKAEGYGVFTYLDDSQYKGEWKDNVKHGKGVFTWNDGKKYDGEWNNDSKHGKGVCIWADGKKYDGEWKNNERHGKGVCILADGNKYHGEWKNDDIYGKGIYTWTDGDKYEGEAINNKIHGKGVFTWADGKKYDGEWKNDEQHGKGVFTWPDGNEYHGEWKNDEKHGYGEYYWVDGKNYKGQWKNGKQHGIGVYTIEGISKEGEWKNGKRVR